MKILRGKNYTTKEDLQSDLCGIEHYRPKAKDAPNLFFRITSGTTGGALTMLIAGQPNAAQLAEYQKLFRKHLLILHPKHCTVMQWAQHFFDADMPGRVMFLDARILKSLLLGSLLKDFRVENIYGFTSLLNTLLDALPEDERGILASIKEIDLTGEKLSESLLRKYEAHMPHSTIRVKYATAEARTIGIPCTFLSLRHPNHRFEVYHPLEQGGVEIVDPNSDGMGEIAVSTPELPHYLTGDAGTLVQEHCPCDRDETLFVYGRIRYDVISCVGALFLLSEVERVFSLLSMYVSDYYMEVKEVYYTRKTYGTVTFYIVPTDALRALKDSDKFVLTYIARHLQVTKTRTLEELIAADIFLYPEVTFVSSLPRSGKKVRMKKIDV